MKEKTKLEVILEEIKELRKFLATDRMGLQKHLKEAEAYLQGISGTEDALIRIEGKLKRLLEKKQESLEVRGKGD